MLQGAIIGMFVGLLLVVVRAIQQKKGGKKVLAALQAGGPEGRIALDGYVKPAGGKVSPNRLLELLERFSWLAVIGDHEDLEAEAESAEGRLQILTQLRAQAAVGLLAHRNEPRDLEVLRELADRIEAEGGALARIIKKQTRDLATLGGTLAGEPLDTAAQQRIHGRAHQSGPGVKVVLLRFLARTAEAAGADPSRYRQEADAAMSKLAA